MSTATYTLTGAIRVDDGGDLGYYDADGSDWHDAVDGILTAAGHHRVDAWVEHPSGDATAILDAQAVNDTEVLIAPRSRRPRRESSACPTRSSHHLVT